MIEKNKLIKINHIDVAYREIEDCDNQFEIIKYVLNCLSDKQLDTTKKLIAVYKKSEKRMTDKQVAKSVDLDVSDFSEDGADIDELRNILEGGI